MEMAKVTSKGQITIPVSIRRRLSINEGDKLLFIDSPDGVVMVNPDMLPAGRDAELREIDRKNEEAKAQAVDAAQMIEPAGPAAADSAADVAGQGADVVGQGADVVGQGADVAPLLASGETADAQRPGVPPRFVAASAPTPAQTTDKPEPRFKGYDVSALLDDIRSIGTSTLK